MVDLQMRELRLKPPFVKGIEARAWSLSFKLEVMMTKQCNKCKEIKELNEFKKKLNQYSHIFIDICKECKIISKKAKRSIVWNNYYKKNKSILNKSL